MAQISDYVTVTVTRGSRPIDQAGFGTPMFLGTVNFYGATERYRIYSNTADMISDGFPSNHPAVKWASGVFGQTNRPNDAYIGRQTYTALTIAPASVANDTDYSLSVGIGGTTKTFTYTSDATATAAEIVDGIIALIVADSAYTGKITPTNVGDELVLTPATGVEVWAQDIGDGTWDAAVYTSAEDVDTALAAVAQANNSWFFMSGQSQADADILKFAAFAQANDKMYFGEVPVSTVGAETVTNIAAQLRDLQYDNTQTITVDDDNLGEYASGALIGSMAATNPGTSVWFGKTLVGASADNFTGVQENNIQTNNSNYYPLVAGVGFYTDGSQASGEFGDTIRFSLWLKARIAESLFGLLKRQSDLGLKVPHNETGYAMVRQAIFSDVISVGIARGAISTAAEGAYDPIIRTPERNEIPANDRANRILPDVVVDLVFSGAIQDVRVKVYVVV